MLEQTIVTILATFIMITIIINQIIIISIIIGTYNRNDNDSNENYHDHIGNRNYSIGGMVYRIIRVHVRMKRT